MKVFNILSKIYNQMASMKHIYSIRSIAYPQSFYLLPILNVTSKVLLVYFISPNSNHKSLFVPLRLSH